MDIEQPEVLLNYLRQTGRLNAGEQPVIRILAGGVSNRTVLVERRNGEAYVLKQALEKLRVKADWFSSPLRIHREAMGMRWLEKLAPAGTITPLIFEDEKHHLLAMAAVPQPHANWKSMLLEGRLSLEHIGQFGRLLGMIHRQAYERRSEIEDVFDDNSFFESLRIEPYYTYTGTQVRTTERFFKNLIDDTRSRRFTIVHGDYSPKNILVYQGRLVLLDHEVIHFGDGAFDLGFSMSHLLSKAHYLTSQRNDFAQATLHFWKTYKDCVGELPWVVDLEPRVVRHALACLLARVAGRSLLEYFTPEQHIRQKEVVVKLMHNLPGSISNLAEKFINAL